MNQRFEAIFFDFDGVLIDSEPVHFFCWRQALLAAGIPLDWETYRSRFIGVSDLQLLEQVCRLAPEALAPEQIASLYPHKQQLFRDYMRRHEPPFAPGIAACVRELAEQYLLGVVTSSARAEVEPLLAQGGLSPYFRVMVCGEDVTRHKPDPEPYRQAAQRLGVRRVLVLEDSDAGEASARQAGFEVLRIPEAGRTVELLRAHLGSAWG